MTPRARARLKVAAIVGACVAFATALLIVGSGRWLVREGKPIAEAVAGDMHAGTLPGLRPGDESSFSFALARVGGDHEADAIRALVPELKATTDRRGSPSLVTVTFDVLDHPDGATIRKLFYFYERPGGDAVGWRRRDPVVISEAPAWEPRRLELTAALVRGEERAGQ